MRSLTRSHRRRKSLQSSNPHWIPAIESLETRALLAAVYPAISLNNQQPVILPVVNGNQLLASVTNTETNLYTTDGTNAGTQFVVTIPGRINLQADPYPQTSEFVDFAILGNSLYFATMGSAGPAIWKTNGTSAGTVKLLQQSASQTTPPNSFHTFNGAVYFGGGSETGGEVYKTDGTTITLVADINPSGSSRPERFLTFDNQLFFTDGLTATAYRLDGVTPGVTSVIDGDKNWSPLTSQSGTQAAIVLDGTLILKRETTASGVELLSMSSATASPVVFRQFPAPAAGNSLVVDGFTIANDQLYFRRAQTDSGFQGEVWKTDGTNGGTAALVSPPFFKQTFTFVPGVQTTVAGDKLVFFEGGQTYGAWWTDDSTLTQFQTAHYSFSSPLVQQTYSVGALFGQRMIEVQDELFYYTGLGLVRINAALTESRLFERQSVFDETDLNLGGLREMFGTVWFATSHALWKYDAAAPDAAPGPEFTTNDAYTGTEAVNGQHVVRIGWNPVPGAVRYDVYWRYNGSASGNASGTATEQLIPFNGISESVEVHVRAVFDNGQFTQTSVLRTTAFRNRTNLQFGGPLPFERRVILTTNDLSAPNSSYAVFFDRLNGQILHSEYFQWPAPANGVRTIAVRLPQSKLTGPGRMAVRVLPVVPITSAAPSIPIEVTYDELSVSFGATTTTINWPAIAGPSGYDIWINDETRNVSQYIRNQNLQTNSYTGTFPVGTYRVWVRPNGGGATWNWSDSAYFTIGGAPKVIGPSGTITSRQAPETISWSDVKGAAGYELWVTHMGTNTRVIHETNLASTATSFTPASDLVPGTYRVWVRTKITGGTFSAWSQGLNFTILAKAVEPRVVSAEYDTTPTISWIPSNYNVTYDVWIGNAQGQQVFRQNGVAGNTFTLPNALVPGQYQISVRGTGANGLIVPWSDPALSTFRIGISGFVYPKLQGNRNLTWVPQAAATHYDIWVNYVSGSQPPQAQIYRNQSATGNSVVLPANLPAGQYRAWIRSFRIVDGVNVYSEFTNRATDFTLT